MGKTHDWSQTATSAKPPPPGNAATRSPARSDEPSGAERTTPANSVPGVNGSDGFTWYSPRVIHRSGKVTPAAWTSLSTELPEGVGSGTSMVSTAAGPAKVGTRTACTSSSCGALTPLAPAGCGTPVGIESRAPQAGCGAGGHPICKIAWVDRDARDFPTFVEL